MYIYIYLICQKRKRKKEKQCISVSEPLIPGWAKFCNISNHKDNKYNKNIARGQGTRNSANVFSFFFYN